MFNAKETFCISFIPDTFEPDLETHNLITEFASNMYSIYNHVLVEINDSITRESTRTLMLSLFKEISHPHIEYAYMVVCDETNNTPEMIDANKFVIDTYIKLFPNEEIVQISYEMKPKIISCDFDEVLS